MNDNELISQYFDGELTAEDAAQLETRMALEPKLRAQLEQVRQIDIALRCALATQGDIPAHLINMLTTTDSNVVELRPRSQQRWGFAIAASLMAGIAFMAGQQWLADGQNLMVPDIAESKAFAHILESRASRASGWYPVEDSVQMRPVLSFASTGGTWCREFQATQQDEAWRGVACRHDGDWELELLVQSPGLAGETAGYQTASAVSLDTVAQFIDNNSTDIPLGRREEASLIANSWR
jgi:anti-sigma factor RsiW